jgi:hypothetical protein
MLDQACCFVKLLAFFQLLLDLSCSSKLALVHLLRLFKLRLTAIGSKLHRLR